MLQLSKYSFGVGDRFAHQAAAQLHAFEKLADAGVNVTPVWNKSNREHNFVGSEPRSVREAAQRAVTSRGWSRPWHVDADHIGLTTVERFLDCSDFFTIDVADFIGRTPDPADLATFLDRHHELVAELPIPGIDGGLTIDEAFVTSVAQKYLRATQAAGEIYRSIADRRGADNIIAEVSMDETDAPQTPAELLVILVALSDQEIPLQTIAPKFTGRFNKGVDYVGDLNQFAREFADDVSVIDYAITHYGLPENLKLSVHSGSDKFSLYPIIRETIERTGAGVHVKTAGTTWLEELIGLAEAGGDGLELAKEIYSTAFHNVDELSAPYAAVIDVDRKQLPAPEIVATWTGSELASSIRHVPDHPAFNASMRQLLHVSFKLAAKAGKRYTDLLVANESIVAAQVTQNIFDRHLKPLFLG